jgi:hypothetical protein
MCPSRVESPYCAPDEGPLLLPGFGSRSSSRTFVPPTAVKVRLGSSTCVLCPQPPHDWKMYPRRPHVLMRLPADAGGQAGVVLSLPFLALR